MYNSGSQSGPTTSPIPSFDIGAITTWDASNPALNTTHSANDVLTIQNYGNIAGVTLTISTDFDFEFGSGGTQSFSFKNLGTYTSSGRVTFLFTGASELVNANISSTRTLNASNSSIGNALAGTITASGITDGTANETFTTFTLELGTSLATNNYWEIHGDFYKIVFTNYGGTSGANTPATHFATQYTDGTTASYRIVSLTDHTTTESGSGTTLPSGWVEAVQVSEDLYLGYKTVHHAGNSALAITDATHNLTDLHIESTGDLSMDGTSVDGGTTLLITNTTAADRTLTFTNIAGAYLRNGGTQTDLTTFGLTLKANTRYLVHITENSGKYVNATEAGGSNTQDGSATNNTLRWDGTAWVESAALTNDGTNITTTGNVGAATATTTGDATVGGNLAVTGTSTLTGIVVASSNVELNSTLTDINNEVGTSGQVLSSTGSGTDWVDKQYLGYKITRHVGTGTLAITNTLHNLTDLHIENTGDLSISTAHVGEGTTMYITNTTAANRTLSFSGFSGAYLRNGGTANNLAAGGLTLKANTRYMVHVTNNNGNYFFNAVEAGGGTAAAATDTYLGYRTVSHNAPFASLVITHSLHHLADVRMGPLTGNITINASDVLDGTVFFITNLDVIAKTVAFTNFDGAFFRSGGGVVDLSTTGMTLEPNVRYTVRITINGGVSSFEVTSGELVNSVSGRVNAGTAVSLGHLSVRIPASGNRSIQILNAIDMTISGTGKNLIIPIGGGAPAASYDSYQSETITANTWTYWNSGLNFGTHGSTQEILFYDEGTVAQRYRVSVIIGSSYNNNMISIERL